MTRSTFVSGPLALVLAMCSLVSAQQANPNAAQKAAAEAAARAQQAAKQAAAAKAPAAVQKPAAPAQKPAAPAPKPAEKKAAEPAAAKKPGDGADAPKTAVEVGSAEGAGDKPLTEQQLAELEAILTNVEEFEKAYNARDAKAIVALFTPEAQMIDEGGSTFQGREEIEVVFQELFEAEPEATLFTEIDDVRLIGTALAIETGRTITVPSPDDPAVTNDYIAVHVKNREGKWLMALCRDLPAETRDHTENLLPLAFLIGDWVDESADAVVETKYDWSDGDKFIVGKFTAKVGGEPAFSGTQRIGWDPLGKKIRSWVFDSNGGFQEGVWTRVGDQWLIKYQGVSGDGEVTAGTSVMTLLSSERWTWQSHDRLVGDEILEDLPEVTVVRKAPAPLTEETAAIEVLPVDTSK